MSDTCSKNCQNSVSAAEPEHTDLSGISQDLTLVSEYHVARMDCPSEENIIRMALNDVSPRVVLDFDIPNRRLMVYHDENTDQIEQILHATGLSARRINTQQVSESMLADAHAEAEAAAGKEAGVLIWLLAINAVMFVIEFIVGWLAQSTGLIADSLDMFADAAVYGVALYAVGYSARMKLRAAHFAGWLQLLLALGALSEVIRRFVFGSEPVSAVMMVMGLLALIANVACLLIIHKQKDRGAHMKASWIFSANDVIANLGVILAGVLVAWSGSRYPDLIIGLIIAVIVMNGARRILQIKA